MLNRSNGAGGALDGVFPDGGEACDGCGACDHETNSRRDFLRQGALALALLAAGRLPLAAAARGTGAPVGVPALRMGTGRPVDGQVLYDVPAADGATIDRDNQVILVRWQGSAYAFGLSCPHQRTMLRWEKDDGRFQCPKHHSKYEPDGTFISGRATRGMDRYAVQMQGPQIAVDTSRLYREDEDPAEWNGAVVKLGGTPPVTGGKS